MMTRRSSISAALVIWFTLGVLAVSCGGGGGGGGSSVTTLTWNAAPAAGSVSAGQTVLYKFSYPNNGTGDPAAQITVAAGGDVAAYLCASSTCGPGQPAIFSQSTITVSDQVWTPSPGAVTDYYVAIHGNAASSYTIQATGT